MTQIETVEVPANRPHPVWTSQPLAAGAEYIVEASGVFSVWGDRWDGVDAYYVYAPERVGRTPQVWSQLLIDDRPMYELARQSGASVAYSPEHVYSVALRGTGQRLRLQILDARNGSFGDNRGALRVRILSRSGVPAPAPHAPAPPPPAYPPPAPTPPPPAYPPPRPAPAPRGELLQVPADRPEAVWSAAPLAPGVEYVVEARGVFSVWANRGDGVDAFYAYAPERVGPQPQVWSQLLIDDRPMYELARQSGHPVAYNLSHVYTATIRGNGQRVRLQILDARNGSWRDNRGGLQVRITPR